MESEAAIRRVSRDLTQRRRREEGELGGGGGGGGGEALARAGANAGGL